MGVDLVLGSAGMGDLLGRRALGWRRTPRVLRLKQSRDGGPPRNGEAGERTPRLTVLRLGQSKVRRTQAWAWAVQGDLLGGKQCL